jgi:hypothetical protein
MGQHPGQRQPGEHTEAGGAGERGGQPRQQAHRAARAIRIPRRYGRDALRLTLSRRTWVGAMRAISISSSARQRDTSPAVRTPVSLP